MKWREKKKVIKKIRRKLIKSTLPTVYPVTH